MNRSIRARSSVKPDRRKLSDVARHVVLPKDIVTTGWPKVEAQARLCGIEYDGWQRQLGRCILGKTADGVYAAGIGGVAVSICRQVGKTFLIGTMIVMLCILSDYPLKVLWTAHRTRTSDERFKFMCALVRRKAISRFVDGEPRRANGQQEIVFVNGSRIMFGARENGFGRGFDSVDIEVFDEAQILTERALDDMIPATNAARNPLIVYMGTPPKPSDPSEVFSMRRDEALKGGSTDMLYVEFSADKDADSDDRRQWAVANPSYPHRTGEAAILRMKKNLGDDSFRREGLGIWDETTVSSAINPQLWANGTVEARADGGVTSFGIDMSPDRSGTGHRRVHEIPGRHRAHRTGGIPGHEKAWHRMGRRLDFATLAEDHRRGHRRAEPGDGAAARTEVTRREGDGEHHQRHGSGMRPRIGHADCRRVEAPARRSPTPIGHGGGERDHEADRQKRRFRLEQGRIRHRHLAVGRLHDGIAGSVDHTPQPEQTAARHALEGKDEHYDGRGHLERGGQTPVGREQPGRGRHRRRGRRGYADDPRIVQGIAGPLPLQSDPAAYAPAVSARSVSVTVRNGDTMSGIAKRTGLWPLSSCSAPSGNINLIYPGNIVTY